MGDPRPENPEMDAEEQAAHLRDTGNTPTADDEATVLEAEFGTPDADGVYGAPDGGDAA